MPLQATQLVTASLLARRQYQDFEMRLSTYGALKAFMDNGAALLPEQDIERFKTRRNNTALAFPVLQKQNLTVITAKSCNFTSVEANSAKPLFTSVTRGFAIKVYDIVADNNDIPLEAQFANGLTNGLRSIAANLDSFANTRLDAVKSTALAAPTGITGASITANAYRIALAQRDKTYVYIPTLMELNDVNTGDINNIMSSIGRVLMLEYETKGQNNSDNLRGALEGSLPSASGFRHYTSNRVTNGVGVSETHYLAPFGTIGLFTFVDSQAAKGSDGGVGNKKKYTLDDPIFGITWGVTERPVCDDLSATYGAGYEECDGVEYRFMADFSFMTAYSSDGTAPVHKLEVMTT